MNTTPINRLAPATLLTLVLGACAGVSTTEGDATKNREQALETKLRELENKVRDLEKKGEEVANKEQEPAEKGQEPTKDPFGNLSSKLDQQEPGKEPSPLERVFQGMDGKKFGEAFPNVSIEYFQKAFAQDKAAHEAETTKKLSLEGFNFGTGIGASFDLHGGSRVKSASIRDGVVRVDEEADAQLGLVLETHYFIGSSKPELWGTGPFVAVKVSENDVIDEAGFGWMLGLRRRVEDTNSFNIGFGIMVDPDAEVLADGFTTNQAPPSGATEVATKKEERFSFAIIFSYTF